MYGFKPQHARGKPVQNFADGGIVHSIKGALGLRPRTREELLADDAKRMAKNREAAAAVAERSKPAPSAPQAQQNAVSGYAGMSVAQRREKELGLADGGRVRPRGFVAGKGTATSDSIPARLSNGEYVLPADTVRAVGVEALDALRESTHKPVKGEQSSAARGFFAGGGLVDDEKKRMLPPSPSNIFPGNRLPGDSGSTSATPPVAPPAAPPATAPAPADPGGFSYADNNKAVGQDIKDSWNKGNYGEAVGKTVAGTVGMFSTPIIDAAGAVTEGAKGFGRGLFGIDSKPDAATPPAQGAAPPATTPATNPTDMRMASGVQSSPMAAPSARPAAVPAPQALSSVGAMAKPASPAFDFDTFQPQSGEGAFRNEQTGRVTRLQDGPSPTRDTRIWKEPNVLPRSDARPASPRQSVRAPVLNPNGGVFAAMADFTNQAGQAMQAIAANKGMRNDRKDALDQQRVGLDAASTFAKIEQGDRALGIDGRRADTAQDLAALQADELGLKREAQGFQTRAAAQQEQLRNVLLDPKSTPEQRAVARRGLAAFSDKTAADRMQTVALPDTTNEMGQVMRGGQALVRVLEDGSVQQVPIGAQQGAALPPGMKRQIGTSNGRPVYEDMNGKQVIAKG